MANTKLHGRPWLGKPKLGRESLVGTESAPKA